MNPHNKMYVEQFMFQNYIKYDSLDRMTREAFSHSSASAVNVYIDLFSMIKSIYRLSSNLIIQDYNILASSVINLCAHIRAYYRSRHRVETKFYIVFSDNCSDSCKQFIPTYNSNTENMIINNPHISEFIITNLNLMKILCPYLNDIFVIEENRFETSVIIYGLMNKYNKENNPNIILTKDSVCYQIPAVMDNNTAIFRPMKKDGQDLSYVVNRDNVLARYIHDTRNSTVEYEYLNQLNPSLLSLLMTLTNVPSRNIKSIFNINKALEIIHNAINNSIIINGYNTDIKYILGILNTAKKFIDDTSMEFRFRAVDLLFQYSIYMNSPIYNNTDSDIINLFAPETVKEINGNYFQHNPLDLNRL